MDSRDKHITRWIDGCLDPANCSKLEAEQDGRARVEKQKWEELLPLLKEQLAPPPLEHPDFFNAQILNSIERDRRAVPVREPGSLPSLRRIMFAGFGSVATALLLTLLFLPQSFQRTKQETFMSQAISAHTYDPNISVATFSAPDNRSLIVWLEGSKFIPAEETVQ